MLSKIMVWNLATVAAMNQVGVPSDERKVYVCAQEKFSAGRAMELMAEHLPEL